MSKWIRELSREYVLSIEKIVNENGCWIPINRPHTTGYVRIHSAAFGNFNLHRLVAHLWHGLDMDDKEQYACHKVECPDKRCFNPEHLYKGDQLSNIKDMVFLGTTQKDVCRCGRPFDYSRNVKKRGKVVKFKVCIMCRRIADKRRRPRTRKEA